MCGGVVVWRVWVCGCVEVWVRFFSHSPHFLLDPRSLRREPLEVTIPVPDEAEKHGPPALCCAVAGGEYREH